MTRNSLNKTGCLRLDSFDCFIAFYPPVVVFSPGSLIFKLGQEYSWGCTWALQRALECGQLHHPGTQLPLVLHPKLTCMWRSSPLYLPLYFTQPKIYSCVQRIWRRNKGTVSKCLISEIMFSAWKAKGASARNTEESSSLFHPENKCRLRLYLASTSQLSIHSFIHLFTHIHWLFMN
jgi:hypothetical protein